MQGIALAGAPVPPLLHTLPVNKFDDKSILEFFPHLEECPLTLLEARSTAKRVLIYRALFVDINRMQPLEHGGPAIVFA